MSEIRHCPDPDCDGVLEMEPFNFYCRTCQRSFSDAQVTGDSHDDHDH